MDIRHLEIFCRIVETGSFSRTAKALGFAQPTVSGHIKTLEDELGVRLFDRLGRVVEPTKAGLVLLDYANKIIQTRDEASLAIEDYLGIIRGQLIVGASTIPGGYLLPICLAKFNRDHTDVAITIEILDSRKVIEEVLEGEFQMGVAGARISHKHLKYKKFAADEIILVTAPEGALARRKKVSAGELEKVPMIVREEGSGTRLAVEERLRKIGFNLASAKVSAVLGDTQAIRSALKAGVGVSIVSRFLVEEDLEKGTLREVAIEGFSCIREFYSVVNKSRSMTPLCRSFLQFIHKGDAGGLGAVGRGYSGRGGAAPGTGDRAFPAAIIARQRKRAMRSL